MAWGSFDAPAPPPDQRCLTVLVPARNAAALLPSWLDSVGRYADAVIALDDGSTDATGDILRSHPLVADVLTNPVRDTYHGWDDLENRQRLVHAALARRSSWLLFLDADETIDEADGKALRDLVEREAQPGFAYGFEVVRMVEDLDHFDPHALWVFRLFSAVDAVHPLGSQRLHFVPVPSNVPRRCWLHTSIRIRHTGGMTQAHREARFAKYLEADPGDEFQSDYEALLAEPAIVLPWEERDPDRPVLLGSSGRFADQRDRHEELDWPALSVVVIAQDDEAVIERSIGAILRQQVAEDIEVILVGSGSDSTVDLVRRRFPEVRSVQLPRRVLPGEARNAGLWMARGDYVSYPGSHIELLPGSLQARLAAHDDGWDMVSGSVVNGNDSAAGWASYFLDHSTKTRGRAAGPLKDVPGSASYVTADVRGIGGFPQDMRAGEDTVVNRRLYFAGKRPYYSPLIAFVHTSRATTTAELVRHHFQRGRALGRILRRADPATSRTRHVRSSLRLPRRRLTTITKAVSGLDKDTRTQYERVRRQVSTGVWAAASGAMFELAFGGDSPAARPNPLPPAPVDAPILALGGRSPVALRGLLSYGTPEQAATRLLTLASYAASVLPVRTALAPIATSATVTFERATSTLDMEEDTLDSYLRAARRAAAALLLQLQPGRWDLLDLLAHWGPWLREADVGVLLDVREAVAFGGQRAHVDDAVAAAHELGGDGTIVLVCGADRPVAGAVTVEMLDLRLPGTLWPHELMRGAAPAAVVYQ